MKLFILNKMKDNIFFQKSKNENNHRNMSLNERYHKRNLTLINTSNSKTLSTFSTLRKIEDLKKKYINMNFQQKKNLKNIFKKITQLNNKYNSIESFKSKTLETETNYNNSKSKNIFLIQTTDQLSLINPNLETYSNSNLYLNSNPNINNDFLISEKNTLKKSNEINYQIKSKINKFNRNKINRLNLKMLKNYTEKNKYNKTIREELLKFGKKIRILLSENNFNHNKESDENHHFIEKNNYRNKSVCPIKERINKLASVKNKIKKINKDFFKENEKNNNSNISFDSQAALDFKHIKPKIMKDNSIEDYFEEEKKDKISNNNLLKPSLIRPFPRPKLNIPKYPF